MLSRARSEAPERSLSRSLTSGPPAPDMPVPGLLATTRAAGHQQSAGQINSNCAPSVISMKSEALMIPSTGS